MNDRPSLFAFRRRTVRLGRDEAVEALRANVSKLQRKLNNTQIWAANVRAKDEKLKRQLALDRAYINDLKEALAFWVARAERFEEQLPAGEKYMSARGVLSDHYALGVQYREFRRGN